MRGTRVLTLILTLIRDWVNPYPLISDGTSRLGDSEGNSVNLAEYSAVYS